MSSDPNYNRQIENSAVAKLILYILLTTMVSILMLAINSGMIYALAEAVFNNSSLPFAPKIKQLMVLLGPVLLFLEWYVWDVFTAGRFRRRS